MLELQHGFQLQCQQLQQALPLQQLVMTGTQTLAKREQAPDFYGYIPAKASKRTVVFLSMLLLSAGMLLIRCTTIVLLGLIGGSWAFLYIGADLGLYLLVKILRGDFWYWMPLGGNIEIVSSILYRVIGKDHCRLHFNGAV